MSLVWITGASQGLGRATALDHADAGWQVVASARSSQRLGDLVAARPAIISHPLDVTDRAATHAAVAAIEAEYGPIDRAVLNAGTHQPMAVDAFDATVFDQLFALNVGGVVNCLAALVPRMVARRQGNIALVSSVAGYRGLPTAAAYGATKAALINMAESLAMDLKPFGVRVQLVNPGFIRTPLTDRNDFAMPALMEPDVAARRLRQGLDSGRFEVTFPKRFTWVLKALRLLPNAIYLPLIARSTRR
ncbi:MAG: SDR family NAD(P)-dependent oxidoreductase [Alphaproteobacteria bacterium]|nr:MAG: SDR family NAD(P)-dependent oxidoreductase [Alphaproteobacteria bacterium]